MKTNTLNKVMFIAFLALLPGMKVAAQNQDWKSILKGVASVVEEKVGDKIGHNLDTVSLTGSWQYVCPDVSFESDDLLSKAGSELGAKKVEEHLAGILAKIGFNENTVFTFNSDSTYTMRTSKRTLQGTYSFNKETYEIVMTSRLNMKFNAEIVKKLSKPKSMILRFQADKLMDLFKQVSDSLAQRSTNKQMSLINNLLDKYTGLSLGFELNKQ